MAWKARGRGSLGARAWNGPEQAKLDGIQTMNFAVFWALNCGETGFFALHKKHILEIGIWKSRV